MIINGLSLISKGGAMRSAYSVGVIKGLREKYNIESFENIVAASGSAANFMYFTSGQFDFIDKIWFDLVGGGNFIKFKNIFTKEPIINIDFLVDNLVRNKYPFDVEGFRNSRTKIFVPVLRVSDGKSVYFSNTDKEINPFELMRATCAIPYFYGKKIKLNEEYYIDGSIADNFGLNKALELNPEKLLVILTEPLGIKIPNAIIIRRILEFFILRKESGILKKRVWDVFGKHDEELNNLEEFKKRSNIFVIQPLRSLPSRLTYNVKSLRKIIDCGYNDVINNKGLEDFINRIK